MNKTISTLIRFFIFFLIFYPGVGNTKDLNSGEERQFSFSGSYKNLFTTSETPFLREDFWSDLNRLRLEFDLNAAENLHLKAVLDNEFLVGSILERREFVFVKEADTDTLFDLDHIIVDEKDLLWRQSLYRLYSTYSTENLILTLGRQRIAWGSGKLWNPTDLFNPINPLDIERRQKIGVDAINLEYFLGSLSSLAIVFAPREEQEKRSFGVKVRTNLKGYDFSAIIGEFRENTVGGFDFTGNIGDAGFSGEATYTFLKSGNEFGRYVVSWDYSFPNTFYIVFEYLYNQGNIENQEDIINMLTSSGLRSASGWIVTRNSNFSGFVAGYEISPLARVDCLLIYDVDDNSVFLGPRANYNILHNMDWTVGMQIFMGKSSSEFGEYPDIFYTSLEWFF